MARSVPAADLSDRVLRLLKLTKDGYTAREISFVLKVDFASISPRMAPLVERGLVVAEGKRKGANGRESLVWKAVK